MKWSNWLIYPAISLLLGGCVAGQSISLTYQPPQVATESLGIEVQVVCTDKRPYILNPDRLSGNKSPNYLGRYWASWGVSWDVSTQNQRPLAENLQRDVSNDLLALGFGVVDKDGVRVLNIEIYDWDFDTHMVGKMWYRIIVSVESANGKRLARSSLENTIAIGGRTHVGIKDAFDREIPEIYRAVVENLVRNNQPILAALKSGKP